MLFDQLQGVSVPQLEDLGLESVGQPRGWRCRPFKSGTPKLEKITIRDGNFEWNSPLLRNVGHLTITSARDGTWSAACATLVLLSSPKLHSLLIFQGLSDPDDRFLPSLRPIHESLRLLVAGTQYIEQLLSSFAFPVLEEIRIVDTTASEAFRDLSPNTIQAPRLEMIVACGPERHHTADTEDRFLNFMMGLSQLRSVKTLEFRMGTFSELGRLEPLIGLHSPPNLEMLIFTMCQNVTAGGVRDMVAKRLQAEGVKPFGKIHFDSFTSSMIEDHGAIREWLQQNVEEVRIGPPFSAIFGVAFADIPKLAG